MREYIGKAVQIIYIDRRREVSFRTVKVLSVKEGMVKTWCYAAAGPRVFKIDNIVDVELVEHVV